MRPSAAGRIKEKKRTPDKFTDKFPESFSFDISVEAMTYGDSASGTLMLFVML